MSDSFIKKHWHKFALAVTGLLSLLLVTLGGISFVLNTQTGTQWVISKLSDSLNSDPAQTVALEEVSGTLFRGLSFGTINIANASGNFLIEDLSTSWNPFSLLGGQLLLSDLDISTITINLLSQKSPKPSQEFSTVKNPFQLGAAIESLQINKIEVNSGGEKQTIHNIKLTAELSDQQLNLSKLALNTEEVTLSGSIILGFADYQPLQATLFWDYDTAINNQTQELAGQLELRGDLRSMQVEHQLLSPFIVQSSGAFISGLFDEALAFELTHTIDSLVLPVQPPSQFELRNVELVSNGNFSELSLDLRSTLLSELFPAVAIASQARYENSKIDIDAFSLAIADDSISGTAVLNWAGTTQLTGSYVVDIENIDSIIELPEQLDLSRLFSAGTFESSVLQEGVAGELVIQELTGQLGVYPLEGQGSIKLNDGALEINQLQLITQSNELLLNGIYADKLDFNWEVTANALQEILVDLSGELSGKGSLTGDVSSPDLQGNLSGRNLAYLDTSIDKFDLSFARIAGRIQSQLDVTSLVYADDSRTEKLSSLNLSITGSESAHQINLAANSDYGDIKIELAGSLPNPSIASWQGTLLKASAETVLGSWATSAASSLEVSGSIIDIGRSCWNQQQTMACFSVRRTENGTLRVASSIDGYPLTIFNEGVNASFASNLEATESQLILLPKLPAGVTVDGAVSGNLSIALEPDSDPIIDFTLNSNDAHLLIAAQEIAGQISSERNNPEDTPVTLQEYSMEAFTLAGNSAEGLWQLSADAAFLSENINDSETNVRGDLSAELTVDPNQALTGNITAGMEDLRWLAAFVPEFSNIEGALNGQANISGSISAPAVTGILTLENAAVSFDRLGISVNDISAEIKSLDSVSIQIVGSAGSDSGTIQYQGQLLDALTEARVLSAQVTGSNFQLINIPDLQLKVSPALTLSANSEKVELNGSLNVPVFNLSLEELPESAIDVSRDVVIVKYPVSRPDLARSLATPDTRVFDIPLSGTVDISLGEEVSFTGFGIKTKLAGNLNIQQSATGSNLTYGELNLVDGEYRIYGRSLLIQQGKFLFFGSYDNPGIDVKATREVNEQTVGVLMNGTLKNINSQLFSTPALADSDIISVLVTGRPFSEIGQQEGDGDAVLNAITSLGLSRSKGLTNQVRSKLGLDVLAVSNSGNINNSVLTIGKYITPEIFVRYGVGLFDSQSKVAVDYSITDRIKLQAESGEFQSLDVIYSVEQ
ncbi:MAG: translocation and assembly module TamB [Paracoccaceae bacterium]|jgi:translocation and assembly module TamB